LETKLDFLYPSINSKTYFTCYKLLSTRWALEEGVLTPEAIKFGSLSRALFLA